jgi:tetratricopeptide (TPR) repeat protein
MSTEQSFVFKYSLPDPITGDLVALSFEEAERLLQKNLSDAKTNPQDALWELARLYSHARQHEKALQYLRKVMDLKPDAEHKASCVLGMGQAMEQVGDYGSAVRYYREALGLEPVNTGTWYFINNNLGYCLNTLGKFAEGERFCRNAIEIDPQRPNAFKNLGISLQGQQKFRDAARCFVQATQANASDPRALKLLEELLAQHPELDLGAELECCRKAVAVARDTCRRLEPVVHRGWRKQWILARQRIASWFKARR